MPRKIVVLDSNPVLPNETAFRYALWADVPAARRERYANVAATSAVGDVTADEVAAIRSGAVVEKVEDARWPNGTSLAQVQEALVQRHGSYQQEINEANPWASYGTSWDGATWTDVSNG